MIPQSDDKKKKHRKKNSIKFHNNDHYNVLWECRRGSFTSLGDSACLSQGMENLAPFMCTLTSVLLSLTGMPPPLLSPI